MKYLITGGNGQLGYDLIKELKKDIKNEIYAPSAEEMDITDQAQVNKIILEYKPDYIFHCAAYTAVDKAEEDKALCAAVNVDAVKNIAVKYKLGTQEEKVLNLCHMLPYLRYRQLQVKGGMKYLI